MKLSYCVAKRNLIKGEQKGSITWQGGCWRQLLVQSPSMPLQPLLVGAQALKASPPDPKLSLFPSCASMAQFAVQLSRAEAPPAFTCIRAHPSTGDLMSPMATSCPHRDRSVSPSPGGAQEGLLLLSFSLPALFPGTLSMPDCFS